MLISRQQGNTFARITGPQRRYRGRVRFFYDPPIRWGGMLVSPMAGGSSHGKWNGEVV
jgi:hypothetical protein